VDGSTPDAALSSAGPLVEEGEERTMSKYAPQFVSQDSQRRLRGKVLPLGARPRRLHWPEVSWHAARRRLARLLGLVLLFAAGFLAVPSTPVDASVCYGQLLEDCPGWNCFSLPTALRPVDTSTAVDPGHGGWVDHGDPCGLKPCFRELLCPCGFRNPLGVEFRAYC